MTVLLAGAGPMAREYARILAALGVEYTAVGRGAGSAAVFEAATGTAPHTGGLSAFLAGGRMPAGFTAIVALPVPRLAAAVIELAEAGAGRILVEKPGGLDLAEIRTTARRLADLPARVFVAYNRRFYASVQAARAMIEEDGGPTSVHFDFTEKAITADGRDPDVLANWFLANSSHVVDLAWHLAGAPAGIAGLTCGSTPWHPAGAVFVGHARTDRGALVSWHADWTSAGRWGIDVRTRRRRLLLQPLEQLQVQERGSFTMKDVELDDEFDRAFKPGFHAQTAAFLSDRPESTPLLSYAEHADAVARHIQPILNPAGLSQAHDE